jgi:hypothetical protein
MARVVAVREIMLRPGVTDRDFERYVAAEVNPAFGAAPAGMTLNVLKGDRGDRAGRYLVLIEFDRVETRDRLFPTPAGDISEEARQFFQAQQAVFDTWGTLATPIGAGEVYTDYVAIDT